MNFETDFFGTFFGIFDWYQYYFKSFLCKIFKFIYEKNPIIFFTINFLY